MKSLGLAAFTLAGIVDVFDHVYGLNLTLSDK
jgi:hypothetical protein